VPDLIEARIGRDPAVDDCLPETCRLEDGTSVETLLEKGQNTMIAMDSSGSMAGPAGGRQTKLEAAKEAVGRYARTAPPALDRLGFLAYGHRGGPSEAQKEESCRGSEVLAPIGEFGRSGDVEATLARFEPTGFTPVAGALETAGDAFEGREQELNRVIVVSDGLETCGGDPVASARRLNRSGVRVTVDVVGLDIGSSTDVERLRAVAVAEAGGGEYADASDGTTCAATSPVSSTSAGGWPSS